MKKFILIVLQFIIGSITFAQISGNQVFGNNNSNNTYQPIYHLNRSGANVNIGDTAILVSASIVKHVKADYYVAVFGVSQEAETIIKCNELINNRINAFKEDLKQSEVSEEDIFVDMVAQYRIYDQDKSGSLIEDKCVGFELTKNIIVKYKDQSLLNDFLVKASLQEIYDLIKVDYIVEDMEQYYDELYDEASAVIKKKKKRYEELAGIETGKVAKIYNDAFATHYPKDQYRQYTAFTSSSYHKYYQSYDRKKERKFTTYYYEKFSNGSFDKVLNGALIEPSVQITLTLQLRYEITN